MPPRDTALGFRPEGLFGFGFQVARPIAYHVRPGRILCPTVEGITRHRLTPETRNLKHQTRNEAEGVALKFRASKSEFGFTEGITLS